MIDYALYDYLEKIVNEQEETLRKYQKLYGNEESGININSVQSIIRRSVIDVQKEDPSYSWIDYGKEGYRSFKLGNVKFDFNFIVSVLSNVPGILIFDKWAIIMVVLTIFAQLQKCKVILSPAMGIVVMFLHENGYDKKTKRTVQESELRDRLIPEIESNIEGVDPLREFNEAIAGLDKLKVIQLQEGGKIGLIEEVIIK